MGLGPSDAQRTDTPDVVGGVSVTVLLEAAGLFEDAGEFDASEAHAVNVGGWLEVRLLCHARTVAKSAGGAGSATTGGFANGHNQNPSKSASPPASNPRKFSKPLPSSGSRLNSARCEEFSLTQLPEVANHGAAMVPMNAPAPPRLVAWILSSVVLMRT